MEATQTRKGETREDDGYIYNIDHNIELAVKRLKGDGALDSRPKKVILEFIEFGTAQGLKKHRQYFYLGRLRILARVMGKGFLNPTEKIITKAIITLQNTNGKRGIYSEASINDFKTTLKKFYAWYSKGKYKDLVGDLKLKGKPYKVKRPEDLISKEEFQKLINNCFNERDKALISLLYDSGMRIGEVLTLRVKDVEWDDIGLRVHVPDEGKGGHRLVRCIGTSKAFVYDYAHKYDRTNPEDYFFMKINGGRLMYHDVSTMLYKVSKRAGLPHKSMHYFRHSAATRYAAKMGAPALMQVMGWKSIRTAETYVHFSTDAADAIVQEFFGIEQKKDEKTGKLYTPQICPRCGTENPEEGVSEYCMKCGMPLNKDIQQKYEELQQQATDVILNSRVESKILEVLKRVLQKADPEFKDKALAEVYAIVDEEEELKKALTEENRAKRETKEEQS